MIIFHAAGNEISGSTFSTAFIGAGRTAPTTFRNNSYIHKLNRTLQAELRTVSAYSGVIKNQNNKPADYSRTCQAHQKSGRQLVKLIIQNRGLPDDNPSISIGLTESWVKLCSFLTPNLE